MARRISMREYQAALSERLRNAIMSASAATVLGVAIGEDRWLVHMNDVSEVLPVPDDGYEQLVHHKRVMVAGWVE